MCYTQGCKSTQKHNMWPDLRKPGFYTHPISWLQQIITFCIKKILVWNFNMLFLCATTLIKFQVSQKKLRYRSFLTWNSRVPNHERAQFYCELAQFYCETSIKTCIFCSFSRVRNCSCFGSRAYLRFFTSSFTTSFESYWYVRGISLRAHSQTYTLISQIITQA